REAFDTFGRVDVWVNNAGADILTAEGAKLPMRAKLDLLLATDLRGTVLCCWEVAERMREQGGGVILNMSWDHALTGMAGPEAQLFAAAKGGVVSFSKCLARSVAPEVRVNVLAPGWIATAFAGELDDRERRRIAETTPLRRWGEPDDVAQAALFLASPGADYLTGVVLPVSGGVVMYPNPDRMNPWHARKNPRTARTRSAPGWKRSCPAGTTRMAGSAGSTRPTAGRARSCSSTASVTWPRRRITIRTSRSRGPRCGSSSRRTARAGSPTRISSSRAGSRTPCSG